MATDIYYSCSPFGTGDIKVASDITIAGGSGAATFTVAQTGNIGIGCHVISSGVDGYISEMTDSTHATIVTALGAAHGNVAQEGLTSIAHEYASISALEAGFTDASHANTTDLVASDYVINACCYYDHDDSTLDTTRVTITFGTSDATRYFNMITPNGGTESINVQRSETGIFDTAKYAIEADSASGLVRISDSGNQQHGTRITGIQIHDVGTSASNECIANVNSTTDIIIDKCILNCGTGGDGIFINGATTTMVIKNTTVYNPGTQGGSSEGIYVANVGTCDIYNCTVYNFNDGIERDAGTVTVTNCAVFGNADDFDGTMTISNCASDDGDGSNAQTLDSSSGYANEFTSVAGDDFSLVSGGVCGENGTDLSGSGVTDDIIGTSRPQSTNYDISAYERIVAGGGGGRIMSSLANHGGLAGFGGIAGQGGGLAA